MAIFDRFKRNKDQKVVMPEEVNSYYQSQRRERVGVAIVLGVVALVVTLLIATILFFGGRYVYRQITGNDAPKAPSSVQTDSNDKNKPAGGDSEVKPPTSPAPAPSTPAAPTPAPSSQGSGTVQSPTATPSTGDGTPLPRTGDEGM